MFSDSNSVYVTIENCTNSAYVSGNGSRKFYYTYDGTIEKELNTTQTGGIVGYAEKVKINNVRNTGTIECLSSVNDIIGLGGTVGELRNGDITNSYNNGEVKGRTVAGIGGILGSGTYNLNINNCYNTKTITGKSNVGGIAGTVIQANITYCYNTQTITISGQTGGGIVGVQWPFNNADYTNNSMWYCYNVGTVTGGTVTGSASGSIKYFTSNYVYGLTGTNSAIAGASENYKWDGGTIHNKFLSKEDLINSVLSNMGSNFKADSSNINNGYPILSWQ